MAVLEKNSYSAEAPSVQETLIPLAGLNFLDCRDILKSHRLSFTEVAPYLQVGEQPSTAEWILYISVIRLEFTPLMKKILPILSESMVPFSIPKDKETLRKMLNGSVGTQNLLKTICIYPSQGHQLPDLAKALVLATQGFRGPHIPSTTPLGGCLYVQYQTPDKTTTKQEVAWPFDQLAPANSSPAKQLWNSRYKPIAVIKPDLKGRVILANYFKGLFNIQLCIIKEGKRNMWADEFGRDIIERLKWQFELYTDLAGCVPSPKIFDLFEEQNNTYLVMEYIKGDILVDKIFSIYNGRSWFSLSISERSLLVSYTLKVLGVIEKVHQKGYVHRDITPGNFIVNKKEDLFLIDMELAYSMHNQKPDPPFKLGTEGYMSAEQRLRSKPTIKEDIYALGALMVFAFTGLPPLKFNVYKEQELARHLGYFTEDLNVIGIITQCLSKDPEKRPAVSSIIKLLNTYHDKLTISPEKQSKLHVFHKPQPNEIQTVIQKSLDSLSLSDTMSPEGIWSSRNNNTGIVGLELEDRVPLLGFSRGIAGILFLLSRAYRSGYDIKSCMAAYERNRDYLLTNWANLLTISVTNDDWHQADKVVLALNEGIQSRLLAEDHLGLLEDYFNRKELPPAYNLTDGISGLGQTMLCCGFNLSSEFIRSRIRPIVNRLVDTQQKDGSWINLRNSGKKDDNIIGLAYGTAGIICFLTNYARYDSNEDVTPAIRKGLLWLIRVAKKRTESHSWPISTKSRSFDLFDCNLGTPGVVLAFIRAFNLLKDPLYKKIAENTLYQLPKQPLIQDFTQATGLSGLGEVYLEAYKAFKTAEWQERLHWIVGVFEHTLLSGTNIPGYWSMNGFPSLDPELMTGWSGIIHFILRAHENNADLTHPLIN